MARHVGKNGAVYLQPGTGAQVRVLALREWTVNRAKNWIDATAFLDGNIVEFPGFPRLEGTFNGFWDDADNTVFAAADSETPNLMYLYPDLIQTPSKYIYGTAYVDYSMTTVVDGMVGLSGNYRGANTWQDTF